MHGLHMACHHAAVIVTIYNIMHYACTRFLKLSMHVIKCHVHIQALRCHGVNIMIKGNRDL